MVHDFITSAHNHLAPSLWASVTWWSNPSYLSAARKQREMKTGPQHVLQGNTPSKLPSFYSDDLLRVCHLLLGLWAGDHTFNTRLWETFRIQTIAPEYLTLFLGPMPSQWRWSKDHYDKNNTVDMKCLPSWKWNEVFLGCDCSCWCGDGGEKIPWTFCWSVCKIKQPIPWRLWESEKIMYTENTTKKSRAQISNSFSSLYLVPKCIRVWS